LHKVKSTVYINIYIFKRTLIIANKDFLPTSVKVKSEMQKGSENA